MKKGIVKFLIFFFIPFGEVWGGASFAQSQTIDSLLTLLKTDKPDTNKVNHTNKLCREYLNTGLYDTALHYGNSALQLAQQLNFKKGIANSHTIIGNVYYYQGNYPDALKNHSVALKLRETLGDKKGIANSYTNIGNVYYSQGNYPDALKNQFASLQLMEAIGDKKGIANSYNNIGLVYFLQGNYPDALKNHFASLQLREVLGNKQGIASSYSNIGLVYYSQGNYPDALKNHLASLQLSEAIGDKHLIAIAYNNIGTVYFSQGNYSDALKNHFASLQLGEAIGDKQGVATSYNNLGVVYIKMGETMPTPKLRQKKYKEAEEYLMKGKKLSEEIGSKEGLKESYKRLAQVDSATGNYKSEIKNYKLFILYRDSVDNEQTRKKTIQSAMQYEFDKKEIAARAEQDKKDAVQQSEAKREKVIRYSVITGLVLMFIVSLIIFSSLRITRKQKQVIEQQKYLVEEQKKVVVEKNLQITESINYAKKIQNALLPSQELIKSFSPEAFIFFSPKDIVSGDFYYFYRFEKYTLLACVDCTGHGVPGGFMSTLGSLLLDKIVNAEFLSPSEILNKLSDEIIRVLHQQDGGEIQEGMDLSICLIDCENKKIEFCGARNGIIVISDGKPKRYKANQLPVGGNYMKKGVPIDRKFETQTILINQNDWIYMYTDGFMEQMGGEDGIPMNYNQFENKLIDVSKKQSSIEKNTFLQSEIDNWRGEHERDDDILIMGFQVT